MKKLFNLAFTLAAAAGAVYYLEQKGILKIKSETTETGTEIKVTVSKPEKPLKDTVMDDLEDAAEDLSEAADDFADDLGDKVSGAADSLEKDVSDMLDNLRSKPDGQF